MWRGYLDEGADVTCPCLRKRETISTVNQFSMEARKIRIPIIHVHMVNRKRGVDHVKENKAAWRRVFPMTVVGPIPNAEMYNVGEPKWFYFLVDIDEEDLPVDTRKGLSAFYPSDLDVLFRNKSKNAIVITRTHARLLCISYFFRRIQDEV